MTKPVQREHFNLRHSLANRLGMTMRLIATALFLALATACAMPEPASPAATPTMTWPDLTGRPQPAPDERIAYGMGDLQFSDAWLPSGPGPHPTVLMIHGGCWQTEIAERDLMNWIADDLRGRGIAVWNVEYRGVDRGGGWPGTYEDVRASADSLRTNAARLNLVLDDIVAVGHSAGGHLALWLAAAPGLPEGHPLRPADPLDIQLVLSQGGIPDLVAQSGRPDHPCGTDAARAMTGDPANVPFASAQAMTPGSAQLVMLHGAVDPISPPEYGQSFARAMAIHGHAVTVEIVPGEGHVELIAPGTASWARQIEIIEAAFNRR